jgi:spore germination cell wall hydrolase CwlJ-like protein
MRNVLKNCLIVAALVAATASTAHANSLDERERQITCLTRNIYEEARSEPVSAQIIVGLITKARVEDERWPGEYCAVTTSSEFSWTLHKKQQKTVNATAWTIAHMIARGVHDGRYELPNDMGCVRWYKRTDGRGVSKNGKRFFGTRLSPIRAFGAHTAYCEKRTEA